MKWGLVLSIPILSLAGCNPQSKLVGKWSGARGEVKVAAEFRLDGTYTWRNTRESGIWLETSGAYQVKDGALTLSPKSITNVEGTMAADKARLDGEMRYTIDQTGEARMKLVDEDGNATELVKE